jgi:hypothetical protein
VVLYFFIEAAGSTLLLAAGYRSISIANRRF